MAYKTLYRVFRPKTFDEVYGQAHITDILKKQVEKGQLSHAYLFHGPRGTGKTSTAKILASAVNCLNPQNGNPCLKCEACLSFAADTFVDVVEIDAASNNSVDNVRDLRDRVSLLPASGKYKVYIIDEVHMLSSGAFNALLKTLEEPPPHAIFILATTELRKLPATILSRCQRYDFKRISDSDIIARLKEVAQRAQIDYEEDALSVIAQAAEGGLRDALSILDQCIAGKEKLTLEEVHAAVGSAGSAQIADLAQAILGENPRQAIRLADDIRSGGVEPHNILRDLVTALSSLLAQNVTDSYQCANILRALEILISAAGSLRYSYTPDAVLTASIVRAAVNTTDIDTKDFELRIKKLEECVDKLGRQVAKTAGTGPSPGAAPQEAKQASMEVSTPAPAQEKTQRQPAQQQERPAAPQGKPHTAHAVQPAEGGEAQTASDSELSQLKQLIAAKSPILAPAADAIQRVELTGTGARLYVREDDVPLAEMLAGEAYRPDLDEVTAEVFGQSKRITIHSDTGEPEDVQQVLFDFLGVDNVTITE